MLENGRAWFVLADGRRARVLEEAKRGAPLSELATMAISEEELYEPQDRPPRAQDSSGPHRHAMDGGRNLHEAEEEKFLKRVADHVSEAHKNGQFEHLVIAAAPRALGLLRNALPDAVKAKIKAEAAKDLIDEDVRALKTRLKDLLT